MFFVCGSTYICKTHKKFQALIYRTDVYTLWKEDLCNTYIDHSVSSLLYYYRSPVKFHFRIWKFSQVAIFKLERCVFFFFISKLIYSSKFLVVFFSIRKFCASYVDFFRKKVSKFFEKSIEIIKKKYRNFRKKYRNFLKKSIFFSQLN